MLLFVIWNRYRTSTLSISIMALNRRIPNKYATVYDIKLVLSKYAICINLFAFIWLIWTVRYRASMPLSMILNRYWTSTLSISIMALNRRIPNKYAAVYDIKLVPSKYAICINLFRFIWLIWTVIYRSSMLLFVISNGYWASTLFLSIDIIWLAWFEFLVFPVFRGIIHT